MRETVSGISFSYSAGLPVMRPAWDGYQNENNDTIDLGSSVTIFDA